MKRIIWRSWSRYEAAWELDRLKNFPMQHQWLNGHEVAPEVNDIYLTTNGYDYRVGGFKKASLYWESYVYLRQEYDRWNVDKRWNHRFHFNPNYYNKPDCSYLGIGTWWKSELPMYEQFRAIKKVEHVFGMVLGWKPTQPIHPADLGHIRSTIVKECRTRSFKYYGTKWPSGDPHYNGEAYVYGAKHSPVKFNDARRLMCGAKFVFATENTYDQNYSVNYLTEKIFHGFLSGSVPIYAGCWNVKDILPGLYIDLRDFNMDIKRVCDHCEKMPDSEYQGYLDRIDEFLHGPKAGAMSCDERFVELDGKIKALWG